MRTALCALFLLLLVPHARAEDVWRWRDGAGRVHYSNDRATIPSHAERVKTAITLEVDRLPGAPDAPLVMADGEVFDAPMATPEPRRRPPAARHGGRRVPPGPPPIYDAARLRFDCYAAGVLYSGGFAHPDDIATTDNCLRYRLGPEAWLNGARAELAMRANGVSPRAMVELYRADLRTPREGTTAED
jgi:hypothetical protein